VGSTTLLGDRSPPNNSATAVNTRMPITNWVSRRLLPSGSTVTGTIISQALTAVCSTTTGTTLPWLRLNNHASSTDEAITLSANHPNGQSLWRVPVL